MVKSAEIISGLTTEKHHHRDDLKLSALDMQLRLEQDGMRNKSSAINISEVNNSIHTDCYNHIEMGQNTSNSSTSKTYTTDEEKLEENTEDEDEEEVNRITSPFPWLPMTALCVGMLAHSVVFTNPLPFVAFMVVDFGMAENVDSAGYYAGWITGTFMIGRTIAGLFWGIASDRYGRRLCLLAAMFNVALFGLLLGFSTSFTMAVLLRLAIGLGNGFMGVAKTCISEICSKEHELRAFGILNGMWGLGLIVGPAVGGLLSRPALQYPSVFSKSSIWGVFPYLLPCLVCSLLAVLAFILLYFWLPETSGNHFLYSLDSNINVNNNEDLKRSKNVPSMRGKTTYPTIKFSVLNGSEMNESLCADAEDNAIKGEHGVVNKREGNGIRVGGGGGGGRREEREDESEGESVREREKNIDNEDSDTDIELGSTSKDEYCNDKFSLLTTNTNISSPIRIYKKIHKKYLLPVDENGNKVIKLPNIIEKNDEIIIEKNDEREYSDQIITEKKVKIDSLKPQTLSEMIRNKDIRFLSILYSYFCFVIMFVDESFPLWAVTSVQKGGLGWSSSQVGSALASVGLLLVIFQLFFYERLIKSCCSSGPGATFFGLACVSCVAIFVLPIATQLVSSQFQFQLVKNGVEKDHSSIDNISNINFSKSFDTASYNHMDHNDYYYHLNNRNIDLLNNSINQSARTYSTNLIITSINSNSNNNNNYNNNINNKSSNSYNSDNDIIINNSKYQNELALWCLYATIVGFLAIYRASATSAFTTLGIVVNDSVDREMRGTLNGFVMTCGSLGNALGPILGSTLYAAAINLPSPLDGRIVFFIGAFILIILAFVAKKHLRKSI